MTNVLFQVAPLGVSIPGAPIISAQPAFPYEPSILPGALGDWMLGPSAASLATFSGEAELAAQAGTHVWNQSSVTLKAAGEALVSNIVEPDAFTFWSAFRWRNTTDKNRIIAGNISAPLNTGGFALANAPTGELRITTYGPSPNNLAMSSAGNMPTGLTDGQWVIAIVAMDIVGVTRQMTGSAPFNTEFASARVKHPTNPLAIGNAFFTGNPGYTPVDVECALFGVLAGRMGQGEMPAFYELLRRRLQYRGITVAP